MPDIVLSASIDNNTGTNDVRDDYCSTHTTSQLMFNIDYLQPKNLLNDCDKVLKTLLIPCTSNSQNGLKVTKIQTDLFKLRAIHYLSLPST